MARNESFESRLQKYQGMAAAEGYTLLTTAPFNVKKDRVMLKCPSGHGYEAIWSHFATSGKRCRACFYDKQRLSNEEVQAKMKPGYTLLDKWKNPSTRHRMRCDKGHEYTAIGQNIIDGKGCGECDKMTIEWTGEEISEILSTENYRYLKHCTSRHIEVSCPDGHITEISLDSWKSGERCSTCYNLAYRYSSDELLDEAKKREYEIIEFEPLMLKCKSGHTYKQSKSDFMKGHDCLLCFQEQNSSKAEKEVRNYIMSLGVEIEHNCRIPGSLYEADVLIESAKLIVEYCGLYWHSEENKPRNYHKIKHRLAKRAGYKIIQIFEDEWLERKDIVKSIISSKLGKNFIVGARNCEIISVSFSEVKKFYEENHIQGAGSPGQGVALVYENSIIAAMTIANHHRKSGVMQLSRYCVKKWHQIPGGAEKLWNAIITTTDHKEIITFADLRWHTGDIYAKLGFVLDAELEEDYSYVLPRRQSRAPKQDFKIINEKQIMLAKGYLRIYDAGKLRFIWKRES